MLKGFADRLQALFFVADATLTCAALLLAEIGRRQLPIGDAVAPGQFIKPPILVAAVLIWPFFLRLFGAYDSRRTRTFLEELRAVVPAVGISTLVLIGFFYLFEFRFISRILVGYFVVLDLLFLLNFRIIARFLVNLLAASGRGARRLLIVDSGRVGSELAALIQSHPWSGLHLVGFVDDDPTLRGTAVGGHPVLGSTREVVRLVQEHEIDDVIVALPPKEHEKIVRLVLDLLPLPVQVRLVPERFEMISARARVEDFWGVPLIGIRDPVITGFDRVMKRAFDLAIGGAAFILLLPLMAVLALAVKLDSPGPAFYGPCRVGENGRLFRMWKFRTMVVGADKEQRLKDRHDPRTTNLGRILRRWSLDELPNLWNVLMGEMSLVGPRPEQPWIVERYEPWQRKRLAAPPGMTGWWQVNGRSDQPLHENVQYDIYYVQNYSPLLDLIILFKTIPAVLKGRGAY
ncbi:MAG TPA: sugar transferase [Chloroflexota bacterium]|nr:sugar transferase [Chloroflexota bacterium]